MSKKILSAVLALVFVMSLFTVSAFAVGDTAAEADDTTYAQEWSLSQPETNGANGEYKVYVTLKANYTVGAIQFVAAPEKDKAILTNVELSSDFTAADGYNADVSYNETSGKVVIIPKPKTASVEGVKTLGAGKVIATLTYELVNGATSSKIAIDNTPKTAADPDGSLIAVRLNEGTLTTATMYYGQKVTVDAGLTIGEAAADPVLVPVEGSLGVVDTTRTAIALNEDAEPVEGGVDGYLYGIQPDSDNYATIEDVFTVEGDGTMEVDGSGTGAMVYVKDLDGNVVATYVAIFFGDVNGDGDAEGTDMSLIDYHAAWMLYDDLGINDTVNGRLLPHYAFAGDVNVDSEADGTDMSLIDYHAAWMLEADGLSNEDGRLDIAAIISNL